MGSSTSADFPTTPGAYQRALNPERSPFPGIDLADAAAAMLAADGSGLLYGSYFGGAGDDFASAVAIDPTGKVWLGGGTDSPDFPVTPDADQAVPLGGGYSAWIATFDLLFPDDAYVSFMQAGDRLLALATIQLASGVIDFEVLTVLIEFLDSFDRLTTLVLLTPAGAEISKTPVDGAGITAVAATTGGAVVAGTTNAGTASGTDAVLLTVNVNDQPSTSGADLRILKTADPAEKSRRGRSSYLHHQGFQPRPRRGLECGGGRHAAVEFGGRRRFARPVPSGRSASHL